VWKAVGALVDEGYPITGTPGRGYVLPESSPVLSRETIMAFLSALSGAESAPTAHLYENENRLSVYRSVDSTNAEAKRRVADAPSPADIPYGSVIIADEQTAGRGRRGRAFYSPAAGSVYLSFILKPAAALENSLLVTIMAAVSVCRAIERVAGDAQRPEIKWVNDIFIGGKKICGILTEAVSDVESGSIETLVLGIGVNINVPAAEFPEDVRDAVGSLRIEPGKRGLFTAALIHEVFALYERFAEARSDGGGTLRHGDGDTLRRGDALRGGAAQAYIMREYRARSMMKDRKITVIKSGGNREAVSRGVADDGGLLVEYADGTTEALRSGEVSIALTIHSL
jgi:BirA family biotin operon repressor/biotin-[acetyl-CoA-carboxylase] ligase